MSKLSDDCHRLTLDNLGERGLGPDGQIYMRGLAAGARALLEWARSKVAYHHVPYAEKAGMYALVRLDDLEAYFEEEEK